nr:hypothetical protein [Methylomarinum sp. Ch1-1]MDP4520263.1 hypothetical protein [Methylomarinum sp. Ch1-1]
MPIDDWSYQEQIELFDGFCSVDVNVELRFQATLKFVQRNAEVLPDINPHIKQTFEDVLTDIVHKELLALNDGAWVSNGLFKLEKR